MLWGVSEKAAVPIKAQIKLSGSRICTGGFFPRRIFFSSLNKSTGAGKLCLVSKTEELPLGNTFS